MANATLIIKQPGLPPREMAISEGIISIGRALDNIVCVDGDSNVSRYHAVIEARINGFWLSDLGSSNGTTLNGNPVLYEQRLQHGDLIELGGSSTIELRVDQQKPQTIPYEVPAATPQPEAHQLPTPSIESPQIQSPTTPPIPTPQQPQAPSSNSLPIVLIVAAIGGGLILTAVAAWFVLGGGGCKATVKILSPQAGATIRGQVPVRVSVENAECIDRITYQIDSNSFATVETPPFATTLNPTDIPGLEAGNHILSAVIVGTDGSREVQSDIVLAFEAQSSTGTIATASPTSTEPSVPTPTTNIPPPTGIDIPALSQQLSTQLTRKGGYTFDPEISELIRSRIAEYRVGGYTDRARRYRLQISRAFRDRGLDPLMGYVLAMSRSKFNENTTGEGVGLWQIPVGVAQAQGYLAAGESDITLKDPKRSAEIAALYTKALIDVFEMDDFMYAIACYGMPLSQAGQLRIQLINAAPDPVARRDIGKMVKLGIIKREQVDRVIRFFAAGIVGENPQVFGLQTEQRFSDL
jgi:hypothetical protein